MAWSDVGIRVEFDSAYELVVSLFAYGEKQAHHTLEMGPDWAKTVRGSLSPELSKRLGSAKTRSLMKAFPGAAVIERCPCDKSAEGFTRWMNEMTRGEAYEYLLDHHLLDSSDDAAVVVNGWSELAELFGEWHEEYFRHLPPQVLSALAEDAEQKQTLISHMPANDLIEQAAIGVRLEPSSDLQQVVLIPQYHFRPWNLSQFFNNTWYDQYPVEWDFDGNDVSWVRLLKMTRALADESRLRILQKVAQGPVRFSDLVATSDVTKSTVHHHLVILRAARLIILQTDVEQRQNSYALNPQLASDAKSLIEQVLQLPGGV